nr:tagaturonate reductase [Demequina sp. TTPB684]
MGEGVSRPDTRPRRILQFGAGNFLRGFVDQMVQESNDAGASDAGIVVVKATARPDEAFQRLRDQRGMFHVVLEGIHHGQRMQRTTLVTSVQRVISAYDDPDEYRDAYLDPDLQIIVSNTTEAGLVWQQDNLDAKPPDSFAGKLTALLFDRWREFQGAPSAGLDIVPCELVADNGQLLRSLVHRHAAEHSLPQGFLDWLDGACAFHDTLVDRIVPGYPHANAETLMARWGVRDEVAVAGEDYAQWAIVGTERLRERLPFDRAGLPVLYVDDVAPYRETKVRVLNGSHTLLAAVGLALGASTVREAISRPELLALLRSLLEREVLPTLPSDPDHARAFAADALERFANPSLEHLLGDIALNSLAKWRVRALPVIVDCWAAGREAPREVLGLACTLLRYAGIVAADGPPVADDQALVESIASAYDPADALRWVRAAIGALGWSVDVDAAVVARLADEVATQVDLITSAGLSRLVSELA